MTKPTALFCLLLALALSLSESVLAQADAYKLYQKYVAEKNWLGARNIGNAIVRNYPGSEAAKKIAPDLPEVSKRADEAQKQLEAKHAKDAAQRKKDLAEKAKLDTQRQAFQKKAVAGLRKERDEVERITFYMAPNTDRGVANQWYLYIGLPDGGRPYLRFKWMYTADTWLFVRNITLNIDGEKVGTAALGHFNVKRDNSGGRIWEWQDQSVKETDIPFFTRLANSKKTIIRYEGDKYYQDRTLSAGEKKAFTHILAAYAAMQAKR